ncbi:MAG TPA: HAMP domain-containing sensor histidine kinase [Bacteroidales bacterium]|mgnify:CR=1 FL=1|nr:HAMP domain-containing sensor histidine kinase [Bacteroidales bacterium]HPO65059.1 HAMP domain-containing sensor histidine kinase [Bacteroidales bacterium]
MSIYNKKFWWKISLIIFAILIGVGSLYYTNNLVKQLAEEESKKIELWAEATRLLGSSETDNQDFGFLLEVVQNNRTVPVILTDSGNHIISYRNLDSIKALDSAYLKKELHEMISKGKRITIHVGPYNKNYVYYKESLILTQLRIYPYVQLGIIMLFIVVAYLAFSSSRRAEQNQVWIGLTKETAHQLGTPTSSLMALAEILKEKGIEPALIEELENDVQRLTTITERFSKVGSRPHLANENIGQLIEGVVQYLKHRMPSTIQVTLQLEPFLVAPVSKTLFEWVIENVCKNAIDAMETKGIITIEAQKSKNKIFIDISDTGKGIPKFRYKTIFMPGYTTKVRGWGLGLSLAKRIIENYHKGKIFVLNSEIDKGTTFRIILKAPKQ